MDDDNEFGEFSSVGEGWGGQNHVTASFNPDWSVYSSNQDWASGVIPNSEHPWNASFPELPKELSNLLTDSLGDAEVLPSMITELPVNGTGHEFGDFEFSLDNPEVVMTTNKPITDTINAPINIVNSDTISPPITSNSSGTVTGDVKVDDDDEFGDFEGPSIPQQPEEVKHSNVVCSEAQGEGEDDFGGFVSTTAEVKETIKVDDDFGSFEATEFVAASSFPPVQPVQPTPSTVGATLSNFGATPTSDPPPSFSAVAESCFHCDQADNINATVDHDSLDTLPEQSSLWSSLQSGLKTTSPLYSWNKSHVEDQYFAALRVDPMLVYTILSFAEEMGMAPLAPQDQLLADEGFQWPDSPTGERPQEVAATLLDLTLSSPVSAAPSKPMSRHESFTLDADLMGLDFTLTDDLQPTAVEGEGLPDPVITEASNSKTADAIADILGLTTNPYLINKDDLINKNNQLISNDDDDDKIDDFTNRENHSPAGDIDDVLFSPSITNEQLSTVVNTSLAQPLELAPTSELMSSQEIQVSSSAQQSLADSKPDDNGDHVHPAALSNAALDLLGALPVVPESHHPATLSTAALDLLSSLPDVTFMLSPTHTKHT